MSETDRSLLLQLFAEAKSFDYPDVPDSAYFEIFTAYHYLKHYELDYSDVEDGIVDGARDGGIDAVYSILDGRLLTECEVTTTRKSADLRLFIFSTKFQDSFKTGVLNDIRVTLGDLLTLDDELFDSQSSNYNDDLIERINEFRNFYRSIASRFPALTIHVIYATASRKGALPEVTTRLDAIADDLRDQFSSSKVDAQAADARILLGKVREPAEEVRPLEISGNSINLPRGPSYVALSKLQDYFKFICRDDGTIEELLFDDNVRDWEGDVAVNKEISATLAKTDGSDFWWLNNGVSVICDSATLSGSTLQIKNPKIVNGLQTSRQIYAYFSENENRIDDRLILVRTITVEDEGVRAEIIRETNRQTPILPAQLVATSVIHKNIKLLLRGKGIYYERRKNHWKNQGKRRAEIVSVTDLAQAMITAVGGRPHVARARPGSLLKNSVDQGLIFNDKYDLVIYEKAVNLLRSVDALIQETLPHCGRRDRNNIKYQVAAKIVVDSTGGKFDPVLFLNATLVDPSVRVKIIHQVFDLYTNDGGTDAFAKSEEFWTKTRALTV